MLWTCVLVGEEGYHTAILEHLHDRSRRLVKRYSHITKLLPARIQLIIQGSVTLRVHHHMNRMVQRKTRCQSEVLPITEMSRDQNYGKPLTNSVSNWFCPCDDHSIKDVLLIHRWNCQHLYQRNAHVLIGSTNALTLLLLRTAWKGGLHILYRDGSALRNNPHHHKANTTSHRNTLLGRRRARPRT